MKIIVTGGAGFLGSNLCEKLLKQNHKVICIDNLITGSEENINELKADPNFKFLNHDATKTLPVEIAADQVYHLASPASPNENNPKSYQNLSFETMLVNSVGTWNICEWAAKNGAKMLFASTSEVYGNPKEHPQKETYRGNVSTTGPRACYDESKRFGEVVVAEFVRKKGLNASIVRIFNTYGPKMADDGRVVITFVKAALENKPFPIFGRGSQTRSFCYVDDLIEGLVLTMEKGTAGEVYNLGNPEEFSVLELAEKVKEITSSTSNLEFKPFPEDDPTRRCPDITKAKNELGWEPKIGLDEGFKKLIDFLNKKG